MIPLKIMTSDIETYSVDGNFRTAIKKYDFMFDEIYNNISKTTNDYDILKIKIKTYLTDTFENIIYPHLEDIEKKHELASSINDITDWFISAIKAYKLYTNIYNDCKSSILKIYLKI